MVCDALVELGLIFSLYCSAIVVFKAYCICSLKLLYIEEDFGWGFSLVKGLPRVNIVSTVDDIYRAYVLSLIGYTAHLWLMLSVYACCDISG
jgi:hypothetical protein